MNDIEISDAEWDAAEERGRVERTTGPRAVSARYDGRTDRIVIEFMNGSTFMFPPTIAQDPQDATPDRLADVE